MKCKFFRNISRLIKSICTLVILAFTASGWAQSEVAEVHASDAAASDNFGWACSISGDTAVVGAKEDTHGGYTLAGSAYIYQRDWDECAGCCAGTNCWGQVAILRPDDLDEFDYFGFSVSISGDIAVVGAPKHDYPYLSDSGAVYIFYRDNDDPDEWGLETTLAEGSRNGQFGYSVSINGDFLIVGEPYWGTHHGKAHIFGRHEGGTDNWGLITAVTASDADDEDRFGLSVAINGNDLAIVGSPFDELITLEGNPVAGSAYIYQRDHGGTDNWGQF